MLFPTVQYAAFFLAVFAGYWALMPLPRARKVFLLAASYFFYGLWELRFAGLLAGMTLVAYSFGKAMGKVESKRAARLLMTLHVIFNLFVLGTFKYYDFFRESAMALLSKMNLDAMIPGLEIVLPVGISFITFQTLTYTIDIYRGQSEPVRSGLDFFVYVAFFPNLLAGPITRARHFLPQIENAGPQRVLSPTLAFAFLISGLFKKLIISTHLQLHLVDGVFANPESYTPLAVAAGIYGYAVQIYCDFSGYSDMAIGSALLLGLRLPDNFNAPYLATSPQDFWRRWHISLSFWLRDYLYIPLGGNRVGTFRQLVNIMITMVLGGLWHGANLTFVVWGTLHGAFQAAYHLISRDTKKLGKKLLSLRKTLGWAVTFHLVCIAWVFFRATDLSNAIDVFRGLSNVSGVKGVDLFAVILIGFGIVIQISGETTRDRFAKACSRLPWPIQAFVMALLIVMVLMLGPDEVPPFLYFSF